ncbi:ribosomal RNA small subunit methyltransferase B [Gottschalkia purinilytica]|uniref:16S rRNA (cytosine(967)-C(5))-methyltransferase n=1 Tax=Gottschalkia purinilytica TaxID=1503 RepID=A0A0L0WBD4_GOTPU|nr:16S rRNA (cytosine(967)-C(5))-methyltransferase RsmB [Gottschalkia purinilytica]KNF08742.1 ribosomal RNA small subunit methyltransferase B [Gottschalkia purinilytica]
MSKNLREVALKILIEINEKEAYSNLSINKKTHGMDYRDSSFIREIVYGVIENKLYIDWVIESFSKIKLKKINNTVKEIIRIGIYQILFMDKVPDSAAVNECVKISKKYSNKGAQGFINGILRTIVRNKNDIKLPDKSKDIKKYLSIKYSHPIWMINKWIEDFGLEFTEELCKANNDKPKLNIRVNTLKISRDELLNKLNEKNMNAIKTYYAEDGIVVNSPQNITETEEFKKGLFQIQDESSMLVAQIMNPKKNSVIIDVCSAPGGKSTHIAQKMNNEGKIISRDIHEHKVKLINENASRLGINIINAQKFDALHIDESLINKADYCLVDAPCTGLGLIRRKPDIKWRKEEGNIDEISRLQYQILKNTSKYLKKGGILIYSTCTINKEENLNVITKFLDNNTEFKLLDFSDLIQNSEKITPKEGYIELFPNVHATDGFFIAKLIKM